MFHSGTPSGLVAFEPLATAAAARGLRLIATVRPGYGRSSAQPGRSVIDVAPDIEAVLDHLSIDTYVAIGHSGGGPHALACRALSPHRCIGAITVAGVGPYGVDGLDFMAGMGEDNVAEFGAAIEGIDALTPFLEAFAEGIADIQADGIIAAIESLLPEIDQRHLRGAFADYLAAAFRTGVANGIDGWRDDDLAFAKPWGFDVATLDNVSIWQGTDDLMVPYAHGQWMASTIKGSTAHLLEGEGHLSILVGKIDEIVDEAASHFD